MKTSNKSNYKKQSQIFNLKTILNNSNNESSILNTKINLLRIILKNIKNIINQNIIEGNIKEEKELKNQIYININKIIKEYKDGNTIKAIKKQNEKYKKNLLEKSNKLNKQMKELKYNQIKDEKMSLIQLIKEKQNILDLLKNNIEMESDIQILFNPKNYFFFDNIYNINNNYNDMNKIFNKKKKLKELLNKRKIYLDEIGNKYLIDLQKEKMDYIYKMNNYIYDKGFIYSFENERYKEKYNIDIELIKNYEYSSNSDSECEEEESNNKITFINKINNLKKKISLSSSEKDTNDQDIKNNDNIIILNKLINIKEKYNKLINEKYELDIQKILILKKIFQIKKLIGKKTCSSSLSITKK